MPPQSKRPDRATWVQECRKHTVAELEAKYEVTYWTIWHWCKQMQVTMPASERRSAPRRTPPIGKPRSARAAREALEDEPVGPPLRCRWVQGNIP